MAQVKVYGLASHLGMCKRELSDTIHRCLMEVLGLPEDARFQRFFPLTHDNFVFPAGRSPYYTVIEVQMMAGRSKETKKRLIKKLYERFAKDLGVQPGDLEVTLIESPAENWGFRGMTGDEAELAYSVQL